MLKQYADYTIEDFVKNEQFIDWVKLDQPEGGSVWQKLVKDYPYQAENIAQARQVIQHLNEASATTIDPVDVNEIWQGIDGVVSKRTERFTRIFGLNIVSYLTAASVMILMTLMWWKYSSTPDKPVSIYSQLIQETDIPLHEVINTSNEPMLVGLSDGSSVTLEKNSRLSYSKDFTGVEREVFLSGEAFFDVTKNPAKPFVVYANELVTKVLGTSFSIKAFEEDQRVIVSVKTGKVSVFANKSKTTESLAAKGVTLIPNQRAIFSRTKETLSRTLVEQPQIVISKEELTHFTFTNAPVASIFEALKKAYGVEIRYDEEVLSGCRLTTSLSNETLYERLDVICEAIDATYKVIEDQVVIAGKRCN